MFFRNLTLALLHHQNGRLKIAGQHEAVLLLRQGASSVEVINTESLGFFVGMVDNIAEMVNEIEVEFQTGDLLVLYTDGVTEAENTKQQQFGQERLIDALLAARSKSSHCERSAASNAPASRMLMPRPAPRAAGPTTRCWASTNCRARWR